MLVLHAFPNPNIININNLLRAKLRVNLNSGLSEVKINAIKDEEYRRTRILNN